MDLYVTLYFLYFNNFYIIKKFTITVSLVTPGNTKSSSCGVTTYF